MDGSSDAPITKEKEQLQQERLLFAKFSPILKKFVEGDDDDDKKAKKERKQDENDDDGGEKRDVGKGTMGACF